MQQQLLWDHRRVMRYLKGENRRPSFPKALPVRIGNRVYDVHCDAAFECGDQVELVMPYDATYLYVFDMKTGQYGYVEGNSLVDPRTGKKGMATFGF
jgi:hypothetical protein